MFMQLSPHQKATMTAKESNELKELLELFLVMGHVPDESHHQRLE
jgi:hypothetical protein